MWARGVVVNIPPCHGGDRRFDPGRARQMKGQPLWLSFHLMSQMVRTVN